MLNPDQEQTIENILAIPVSAIRAATPEQFTHILQNALEQFSKVDQVETNEHDTLPAAYEAHQVLEFVVSVLKILTEQIELVRNFTPQERKLMDELDRKIGQIGHRMARTVAGLKKFEAMDNLAQVAH